MLILTNAGTDKLQIITSATCTVDVHVSWVDKNTSTGALVEGRTNTAITTATTTDISATPGASTVRNIKSVFMRNKNASTAVDVTVQYNANATLYEPHKVTLLAGEVLEFFEGVGFFKLANTSALNRYLICTSDVVNATTSFADITGLTCPVLSGKNYNFQAHLYHVNDASTTGSQFGYNLGAAPTSAQIATIDTVTTSVTASAHSAGAATARDTAATAQTTGSTSIRMAILSGWIKPSQDDTFALRCKSEVAVAAGLTIKAGSWCRIWEATG